MSRIHWPHFHRWECVRDTGITQYFVCAGCGERRINQHGRLRWKQGEPRPRPRSEQAYQPMDGGWLRTGAWTRTPPPPFTRRVKAS